MIGGTNLDVELDALGIKFAPNDIAWIKTRLSEGRHMDFGDLLRDLVRRDQEGLPLSCRMAPQ